MGGYSSRLDLDAKIIRAALEEAELQYLIPDAGVLFVENNVLEIPIPVVFALAFAPNGRSLIYCDSDGAFEIDAQDGKLARTISPTTANPGQKACE
jgi:hypothetical protein